MPPNSFSELTLLCHRILENPKDLKLLEALKQDVKNSERSFLNRIKKPLLACVFPYLKMISEDRDSLNEKDRILLILTLKEIFEKIEMDNVAVFFNFYSFLLFELYDHSQHKVLAISEEQKLAVLETMSFLIKSISPDIIENIYNKNNVPKLSQIVYVCGEFIKNEKSKEIRNTAVTCLMAFAKALDSDDQNDVVLRSYISEVFIFFLPGIVGSLTTVILETTWTGHKLISTALKAFGRIIGLVAHDYNATEDKQILCEKILITDFKNSKSKTRWKNKEEIDAYIKNTTKSKEWYKNTDENLCVSVRKMFKVTSYENTQVKLELVEMVMFLCRKCDNTLPLTISSLIELLITLAEDEDSRVSEISQAAIDHISDKLACRSFKNVFESLEDNFFNAMESLPRKFNSVDDNEKITAINLLSGYVKLLGNQRLGQALMSNTILDTLVETLLHVSEIETSKISLLEECDIKHINPEKAIKSSWINFKHFRNDVLQSKLDKFCALLSKYGGFEVISNRLLDTFFYSAQHKKEAVYLLNCHVLGLVDDWSSELPTLKSLLKIYTDESYNDLVISNYDPEDYSHDEIQNNVIQICLLTEGVGKIAVSLKIEFRKYLLQSLYLVLRSTGSGNPLVRTSGLSALINITSSCGYADVTDLVNSNFDYFSYQVGRKLKNVGDKEDVLGILTVVLDHCSIDILEPICHLVEDVLLESHNKFKRKHAVVYLQVFKAFILAVRRWFDITVKIEPLKSRKQKEMEYEEYHVTGADEKIENFSDEDVMKDKTAEDFFKENMEKKGDSGDEGEDYANEYDSYKKPEPPLHIKITVQILKTSLHFLPSKDKSRKILVLDILTQGVEVLKDFEDDLLPIVHQIWSPLTQRFRVGEDPLIINKSFGLLAILARLAKDFIRMRTVKEVLPNILELLKKLSADSYLKDKGAAYRYTQAYKLQINVLKNLGCIVANLDMLETTICQCMECVYLYLSDKQPSPLQVAALKFFRTIQQYDDEVLTKQLNQWNDRGITDQSKNLDKLCPKES